MERITRSNSKNKEIGAKNIKTEKQKQSPKGVTKNVKSAIRKMKTAIKRHVIGPSSTITHGPPNTEVKNNSIVKKKANANMQKESPNKRNNRQTAASSKDISNISGHSPVSSLDKVSKKKIDNSKRTGKNLKAKKKIDKSKMTTLISQNSNLLDSSNVICSKAIRNKWLNKRIEKEQLEKSITPEVKKPYSAKDRLQQLRNRLSKEAEYETSTSRVEPEDIVPKVAVLKPLVNNNVGSARQPTSIVPRETATDSQREELSWRPRQPVTNNDAAAQPLLNTHNTQYSAVQLPLLNLNVQNNALGQLLSTTYVQNNAPGQLLLNTYVQNSAASQSVPNTYVQNSAASQSVLNTYVQSSAASQSVPNTYVQNSAVSQSVPNSYVQTAQPTTSQYASLVCRNIQTSPSALQAQVPVSQRLFSHLNDTNAVQTTGSNVDEMAALAQASAYARLQTLIREEQCEDMDVDMDESISPNPFVHSSCPQSNQRLVIVIDTNVFIHKLSIIRHVVSSYFIGFREKPTVIIPWRVINELDALKDNRSKPTVQRLANDALNYLYEMLPKQQGVQGQTLSEANNYLIKCEVPDDEILNCCVQQAAQGKAVLLLTNDKNLCNKATINGIKNMSSYQIESKLEDRLFNYAPGELVQARFRIYKANIYNLLSTILRNEIERVFEDKWPLIIYINPPWSLLDVLSCIIHHWIALFQEIFPRIKHSIVQLKNLLSKLENKDVAALTDNDVGAFQAIGLYVVSKSLVIPDYIELASVAVNALKDSPHMDEETKELRHEKLLNGIFNNMYTYISSYCARVCTALEIEHNLLDESLCRSSLDELLTILPLYNRRVNNLTQTLLKSLNASVYNLLPQLIDLNSICVEINENFAFINKCETSPTRYFGKCRDLFIKEFESYSVIGGLLKQCLVKVRANAFNPI